MTRQFFFYLSERVKMEEARSKLGSEVQLTDVGSGDDEVEADD